MSNIDHKTMKLTFWKIFDRLLSHPWQVSASYLPLVSRIEEAIIALNKLFMALKEIHHLIPQLWHIEITWLKLEQVFFFNAFPDGIKLLESEIVETFVCIILKHIVVLLVSAEQAHKHTFGLISW